MSCVDGQEIVRVHGTPKFIQVAVVHHQDGGTHIVILGSEGTGSSTTDKYVAFWNLRQYSSGTPNLALNSQIKASCDLGRGNGRVWVFQYRQQLFCWQRWSLNILASLNRSQGYIQWVWVTPTRTMTMTLHRSFMRLSTQRSHQQPCHSCSGESLETPPPTKTGWTITLNTDASVTFERSDWW